ncbi:MAG: hypothetical protein HY296_05440 [Thaumarchaeota archaeon]|nr:hypothetical protein [Nitrososphaerota archaeon]
MDYFAAVQQGRTRVQKAVEVLQEVAGPSYPLLFLKIGNPEWTPVGEELLCAIVPGKNSTGSVVLCDSEGNSKAMSTWVKMSDAESFLLSLDSKGIPKYEGEVKLPT